MTNIAVIPAINAEDFKEITRLVRIAESFSQWVHLDVADGTFTKNTIWHNPADLKGFKTPLNIELHLMVSESDSKMLEWMFPHVSRIIVHIEALSDPVRSLRILRSKNILAGIALCRDTPPDRIQPYAGAVDVIQTLSVTPGTQGQQFDVRTIEKIRKLKALYPAIPVEVDGGVRIGIARQCANAGASILVAASSIFSSTSSPMDSFSALLKDATV